MELNKAELETARKQLQDSCGADSAKKDALIQDLEEQVFPEMLWHNQNTRKQAATMGSTLCICHLPVRDYEGSFCLL